MFASPGLPIYNQHFFIYLLQWDLPHRSSIVYAYLVSAALNHSPTAKHFLQLCHKFIVNALLDHARTGKGTTACDATRPNIRNVSMQPVGARSTTNYF